MRLHSLLRRIYRRWFRQDPLTELVARGLTVGRNPKIENDVSIDWSHCWHISIGDDVTLAPSVRILAHDASTKQHLGFTRIGKVRIGDRVFVGASSIVLPGVTIGDDVIIGAGSIVSRDIPTGSVACGSPARVICSLQEYLDRKRDELQLTPTFDERYTLARGVSDSMKLEMNEAMKPFGYVD